MDQLWWNLPGPAEFLDRIVADLRAGRNCVLCLPADFPGGLRATLASLLEGQGLGYLNTLYAEDGGRSPLDLLFELFAPEASATLLRTVRSLFAEASFAGRMLWLEQRDRVTWQAWKAFLGEYERFCRPQSLLSSSTFCVALYGEAALDPPGKDETGLAIHRWQGQAAPLDALMFASFLLRGRALSPLFYEICTRIIANVALWDSALAGRLAETSESEIFAPENLVAEVARDRGWSINPASFDDAWSKGAADYFGGRRMFHPAALPEEERRRQIRHAIWSSEVAVLLPLVEEHRRELIPRLRRFLKVPYITRFEEVINDIFDLEIGHIENQIITWHIPVGPETFRHVRLLREVRNHLSHLEPVPLEMLTMIDRVH